MIEQSLAGGIEGVVVTIRRTREGTRRSDERPGNHTADAHPPADDREGDLAHPVQLRHGNHVLVRGDLKDAVR